MSVSMVEPAVELIANHIRSHRTRHPTNPFFVGLQGPQGSGKSYLSALVQKELSLPPESLRVVVLSIDDLYLPHQSLLNLAKTRSGNLLWRGRGQPGTHDVEFGVQLLSSLKEASQDIKLPSFDKSLFNGEGDRLPMDDIRTVVHHPPAVDVVILEGWCVGFYPISSQELDKKWDGAWKEERRKLHLAEHQICKKLDVEEVNHSLREYLALWQFFDAFVQLKPGVPKSEEESQYSVVYKWRLEQEHYMKSMNGNKGMSDDAVKHFVDRYIPGYLFFGDLLTPTSSTDREVPLCAGKRLTLVLDGTRQITEFVSS